MLPAARLTDMHTCPMWTAVVPHIGGPIGGPGAATILIGGMPAATMGTTTVCVGPPDSTMASAVNVLAANKPICRLTDLTSHGGVIVGPGCPTVLIGGPAPPAAPPPPDPPSDMSPAEIAMMLEGGLDADDLAAYRACVDQKMSSDNPPPQADAEAECKKQTKEAARKKG